MKIFDKSEFDLLYEEIMRMYRRRRNLEAKTRLGRIIANILLALGGFIKRVGMRPVQFIMAMVFILYWDFWIRLFTMTALLPFYPENAETVLNTWIYVGLVAAIVITIFLIVWSVLFYVFLRRFFPVLIRNQTDFFTTREGRVWWISPNRITKFADFLKAVAGKPVIPPQRYLLYRPKPLLNPFNLRSGMRTILLPKELEWERDAYSITFPKGIFIRTKDGAILKEEPYENKPVPLDEIKEKLKTEMYENAEVIKESLHLNPELKAKLMSSSGVFIPSAILEEKEHMKIADVKSGHKLLKGLIQKFEELYHTLLKTPDVSNTDVTDRLSPVLQQIISVAQSIRAAGDKEIPDPKEFLVPEGDWDFFKRTETTYLDKALNYVNELKRVVERKLEVSF